MQNLFVRRAEQRVELAFGHLVTFASRRLQLLAVAFPGARLVSNDTEFDYRIYQLDRPMAPGESRELAFRARREQIGFRNSGADQRLVPNGTFLNNFELAPLIGMNRFGLLPDRATRRRYGLPPELRPARLEDLSATGRPPAGRDSRARRPAAH